MCTGLIELDTATRIVILQHPRESNVPIGTARLAELSFKNSERHVGVELDEDPAVALALSSRSAPAFLLFPGETSRDLDSELPSTPATMVVIDGTWSQAKKMLKKNPKLQRLPRYSLDPRQPSRYRIRREPAVHCVSTIEAIVLAVEALERRDVRPALRSFDAMVEHQLRFARECGARRQFLARKAARKSAAPQRLRTRAADLVVAYGEANAWPRGTELGRTPELVHWAAERVLSGERFEARIAPHYPLSPSFITHTGIEGEVVLGGESRTSFAERWNEFLRPTDLLCCWGYYASELLRESGATVGEHLDVRVLTRQHLRKKAGDVLDSARALDANLRESWAPGRTGLRLAGIAAVVRRLLDLA